MTAAQWVAAAAVALWAQAIAVDLTLDWQDDRPRWMPWLVLAAGATTVVAAVLLVRSIR